MPAAAGISHSESAVLLLLFLRRCLFRCRFLRMRVRHMLLRSFPRPFRRFHFCAAFVFATLVRLLHLYLFLWKFRRLERLSIKSNLGDADRGVVLPVSAQLLILLLALVVEDQDLLAASLLDDLASYKSPGSRRQHAARLGRNRQHVAELDLSALIFLRFHPDHVARA